VEVEQRSSVESILNLGVFWPLPLATKRFGNVPKSEISSHKHKGITYRGVKKDIEYGNPIGTFLLRDIDDVAVKKVKEITSSDCALRGLEEIREIFEALRGRLVVKAIMIEKEGSVADVTLKSKMQTVLDDGLDDVWDDGAMFSGKDFCGTLEGRGVRNGWVPCRTRSFQRHSRFRSGLAPFRAARL